MNGACVVYLGLVIWNIWLMATKGEADPLARHSFELALFWIVMIRFETLRMRIDDAIIDRR